MVRGEISCFNSSCGGNLGFPLELRPGCSLKTRVFSATSDLLSSFQVHLGILLESWQDSRDASQVVRETQCLFPGPTGKLEFLSILSGVRHCLLLKHATLHSSGDVKGV